MIGPQAGKETNDKLETFHNCIENGYRVVSIPRPRALSTDLGRIHITQCKVTEVTA